MNQYIVFDEVSGRIVGIKTSPMKLPKTAFGEGYLEVEDVPEDLTAWKVEEGELVPFTSPQAELIDATLRQIRSMRIALITGSDWTQVEDAPISPEKKQAWRAYRQALRDLPSLYKDATDISQVVWPTKPE